MSVMSLRWRAARQAHREHGALARLARHRDVPAHHPREFARDGKAETGAAKPLRSRGVGLRKLLEDFVLLLRGHADAGIGDRHLNPVAAVPDPTCSQLDLAFLRKFAGIAQ